MSTLRVIGIKRRRNQAPVETLDLRTIFAAFSVPWSKTDPIVAADLIASFPDPEIKIYFHSACTNTSSGRPRCRRRVVRVVRVVRHRAQEI